jgi:hypothetical protein
VCVCVKDMFVYVRGVCEFQSCSLPNESNICLCVYVRGVCEFQRCVLPNESNMCVLLG